MKNWLPTIKIGFFSAVVLLQLFVIFSPAQVSAALGDVINTNQPPPTLPVYNAGVDQSIKDYLCTPQGNGTDLVDCVGRLYRFGISAGAIMLVFFLVSAGYLYITGGEASKTKAKQILLSAFTGMGIMLGSYVLLNFINPNLVQVKVIQPPIFNSADLPSCEDIGFASKCIITTGDSAGQVVSPPGQTGQGGCFNKEQGGCTKSAISACPQMAAQMDLALRVCNKESGGGNYSIKSSTDLCRETTTGQAVSFSIGLWQINMENSAGDFPECAGVLTHVSPGNSCVARKPYSPDQCSCKFGAKGRSGYDACVAALSNPQKNTQAACKLFNSPRPNNWGRWGTSYNACKNATS